MCSKNIFISFTGSPITCSTQELTSTSSDIELIILLVDKYLCASTVDVGSDGGMLEVTMSPDVDEGPSLDAEEEGPRSVSGSVGVVAKLLQSLPTAGV